jgi:hypothetical protein
MRRLAMLAVILPLALSALSSAAHAADEPRTAAAVKAADDGWADAETRGDTAYIDRLLMPEYRSVSTDGKVTTKVMIVAGAAKHKGDNAFAAEVASWRAAHPSRAEVQIDGDTAILSWIAAGADKNGAIMSCDIFVYRDGRWRALYSQHSTAGG